MLIFSIKENENAVPPPKVAKGATAKAELPNIMQYNFLKN
jgi:hypothetical protein